MANEAGTAFIEVRPDLKDFGRSLSGGIDPHVDRSADNITSKLGGAFRGVASLVGGIGLGLGAVSFFKGAFSEAEEARKTLAQTNAVIASTGGAAGVSAKDVGALADKLSALTGIDDEAIASTENLLLTFTGIGKASGIFEDTTKAVLDMSVALGQDTKSSAIQLGKALNDPIHGITALQRVGVAFTEQQKEQIKTLVESGHTLEAQKIILAEINKEFGGSAAAAASPMAKLKVAFDNLKETVGTALLPTLSTVATFLATRLPGALSAAQAAIAPVITFIKNAFAPGQLDVTWLDKLVGGLRAFVGAFKNASDGVTSSGFAGTMERIGIIARSVFDFISEHARPILIALGVAFVAVTAPITGIVAALIFAYTRFEDFRTVVDGVVQFLTGTVLPAIAQVASYISEQFGHLADFVREHWAAIQEAIGHVIVVVQAIIQGFIDVVLAAWHVWGDEILNVVRIAFDQIQNVVDTVIAIVAGLIEVGLALINGDWGQAWDGIKDILSAAWDFIKETVVNAIGILREEVEAGLSGVVAIVGDVPGRILDALGDLGGLLYHAGRAIINGLKDGIVDAVQGVYDFVSGIAGKIASLKGPLDYDAKLLIPAGSAIMGGLVKGLKDEEHRLVQQLGHVTGLFAGVSGGSFVVPSGSPVRPITAAGASAVAAVGAGAASIDYDRLADAMGRRPLKTYVVASDVSRGQVQNRRR